MALQEHIAFLERCGIPATVELPGKRWEHSAEYLALRVGGYRRLTQLLKERVEAGDVRARIQLALLTSTKPEEVVSTDGPEEES